MVRLFFVILMLSLVGVLDNERIMSVGAGSGAAAGAIGASAMANRIKEELHYKEL